MAIFGLLLKSIFLVALMAAVLIIGVIIYLYMRVKRMARTFAAAGRQTAGATKQGPGRSSGSNGSRKSAAANSGSDTAFNDEELYDERSTHEINRKIFSKDEGEYIDYEEVK